MNQILVSNERLKQLSMLADWQLVEMGFDPASVTAAAQALEVARQQRERLRVLETVS